MTAHQQQPVTTSARGSNTTVIFDGWQVTIDSGLFAPPAGKRHVVVPISHITGLGRRPAALTTFWIATPGGRIRVQCAAYRLGRLHALKAMWARIGEAISSYHQGQTVPHVGFGWGAGGHGGPQPGPAQGGPYPAPPGPAQPAAYPPAAGVGYPPGPWQAS